MFSRQKDYDGILSSGLVGISTNSDAMKFVDWHPIFASPKCTRIQPEREEAIKRDIRDYEKSLFLFNSLVIVSLFYTNYSSLISSFFNSSKGTTSSIFV